MKVYCTSKNSGPTIFGSDPISIVYLGTSLLDAREAVGDFTKYLTKNPSEFVNLYSAIPARVINWRMNSFYMADGWWYSIVEFELRLEE